MTTPRIRTRFAPSPTGDLHIGSARSALYPYLWAKHNQGDFLLRIEDTDQSRTQEGSLESITDGLKWLGLEWDEGPEVGGDFGPYFQSERLELYKTYAQKLLDTKHAYYCFCTKDRLDQMRLDQQANKQAPRYDKTCRRLSAEAIQKELDSNTSHVIRLAVPEEGSVVVEDLLRGTVSFEAKDVDDQVIMKSDGFPTYHLANVVDDHHMEITHVIRGEEWLPALPKHVLLYQAFGWEQPVFVHLSLFLAKEGGKVSKRKGAMGIFAFRDQGYLKEAILNFCAMLGWNPKTGQEIFSIEELIAAFELKHINIPNPLFETDKLNWLNQQYLKQLPLSDILRRIEELAKVAKEAQPYQDFLAWFTAFEPKRQESIWEALRERISTLLEATETVNWLKSPSYQAGDLVWKKSTKDAALQALLAAKEQFVSLPEDQYLRSSLEPTIIDWIKTTEWGNGDILWPVRYALTGQQKSPSPFEMAELLGKNETISRLETAIKMLSE